MSNPLVNSNNSNQTDVQNAQDFNKLYQQFQKNPIEFLIKSKLNIPQNIGNNPQEIVKYLFQSGQVPKQLMPRVQQMLGK